MQTKKIRGQAAASDAKAMVEDVIRCKWRLTVIDLVHRGINRPGAMVHAIEGLTTKVLNERLNKMQRYGILERTVFPEKPLRVEYHFSEFGCKFLKVTDAIDELAADIAAASALNQGNETDE